MQLKVLAFDSSVSQFNVTGASPWLREQDYPTAYIDSSGRNTDQEFFTFDPPKGAVATINSVTLYVYGWVQNAGQMAVEINGGDTGLALPTGGVANRAWASVDVSGILTTWAQIAAAQLGFDRTNNTANSGADAAYLLIDYDLIDGTRDLAAGFTVRRPASQELLAEFVVQEALLDGSEGLLGEFTSRKAGSQTLLGEFIVRHDGSQELLGVFDTRRSTSQELPAELIIRQSDSTNLLGGLASRQAASRDAPGELIIRQSGSQDLASSFNAQVIRSLPAGFTVRRSASQELLGELVIRYPGNQDLPAEFLIAAEDFVELPAEFIVQSLISDGSEELFGKLNIRHPASQELSGEFEIRRDSSDELAAEFDVRHDDSQDLPGGFTARESAAQNLPARLVVQAIQASSEDLLSRFTVQPHGSTDLPCGFIVSNIVGSAELSAHLKILREQNPEPQLKGIFTVNQVNASTELGAHFNVHYRRIFGENWQRKSWFTDPYYWRSYYSLALDSFIFEYIHKTGLTGNVWTENVNARISAAGFDAAALEADFSVRGPRSGLPITIVYSDGRDVWVAESDETSVLGWGWQNLTKVFDATAPDWYRYVGVFADRRTPTSKLYVVAVYYDDAPGGVQYVRWREQTNPGDITGWDAVEDVSNTANTDNILGVAGRSMGATGATKKEVIVVYKEGIAIRSRYHTAIGWSAIQDVDTTAEAEKSLACFDIEHYETLAGNNMMHIIYVDADNAVWAAERDPGAAVAWGTFVNLDASATEHDNVGIVDIDSIQFYMWQEGHNIGYRIHRCDPETWWPALVNTYNEFDPSTEAVITTTSQPEQIQGPDDISAGDAVAINWIGLITAAAGKGWGILQPATSETLIGGFVVRHSASVDLAASFDGQVSLNFPAGFIVRQPASEELPAEFDSGQDWENFPAQITVRHSASRELHAGFDGQVSLNLPAEFSSRRSSQQELSAGFEVAQGTDDLPGEFVARQPSSQNLLGTINIIHSINLPAEFKVRNSSSKNLLGDLEIRNSISQELVAAFFVRSAASTDLLGGFISRKTISPVTGVVIAYNPRGLFNIEVDIGTGFVGGIKPGSDKTNKAIGESSMKVATRYEEYRNDYVTFGWRYRYPQIPEQSREVKGGFLVNQLPAVAEGLRDYTSAKGWQVFVAGGLGDSGYNAEVVPKADGTIDLFARAASTSAYLVSLVTYRTWKPTAGNPVVIIWDVEAGAAVVGASEYNTQTLGALCLNEQPFYSDDSISLTMDAQTGSDLLSFLTNVGGQGEYTVLTGEWDPEIRHQYKIIWSTVDVKLYVDNILKATHTVKVPDIELHFAMSIQSVNDSPPPDVTETTLTFHSFSPLL